MQNTHDLLVGTLSIGIPSLRLFLLILTKFPFFQKHSGCNIKGIRPTTTLVSSHARIFGRHYSLPVSLKTSTSATHHVVHCVSRLIEEQQSGNFILLHEAQSIHCNHFRMQSFCSPFHFPLIVWLKVCHVRDRILAEMVSISPNITAIPHHVK